MLISYILSDRKVKVLVEDKLFTQNKIVAGVVQGSVLVRCCTVCI
jgi:hypothetical protein